MTTQAKSGRGTLFKRAGISCAELKTLGTPKVTRDTIDATSFDSSNYEEFILGIFRSGTCQLGFINVPTDVGQAGLKSDLDNGTTQAFTIEFPFTATKTLTFNGIVTEWEPTAGTHEIMMLNVGIKVSGAVSWT